LASKDLLEIFVQLVVVIQREVASKSRISHLFIT